MLLKDLLEVTQRILKDNMPPALWQMDVSTIRYYDRMGLLDKAKKTGRNNEYNADHVRQLLILKVLQSKGNSLSEIQEEMRGLKNYGLPLEESMSRFGIENKTILEAISSHAVPQNTNPKTPEGEETQNMITEETTPEIWSRDHNKYCSASVAVTDYEKAEKYKIADQIKIGNMFAFVDTEDDELAKEIHKLMHGQKTKGKINQGVFHLDGEIEFPSVKITNDIYKPYIGAVVSDKDVYQEGTIAKVFAFIPQAQNKEVEVKTQLNSAIIDTQKMKLDENGCILFRVPILVSGSYDIDIYDGNDYFCCEFEGAKYQLVPLTVSANCSKTNDTFKTSLQAEKYGAKYSGMATASLRSNNTNVSQRDVEFKFGQCEIEWPLSIIPNDACSIVIQDKQDRKLVASTPLTGSKQHERTDTEVCALGKVTSVSMVSCPEALSNRGLYFKQVEVNNSPVVLQSCFGSDIVLKFNETASNVLLVTYDPLRKTFEQHEWKKVEKNKVLFVPLKSEFVQFHIGCFFGHQGWEGHGLVSRPSLGSFSITAPKTIEPSQTLKIKIKTSKPASVLLKVCDKRMRASYEPMSAMASSMMESFYWLRYGYVGLAQKLRVNYHDHARYASILRAQSLPRDYSFYEGMKSNIKNQVKGMLMAYSPSETVVNSIQPATMFSFNSTAVLDNAAERVSSAVLSYFSDKDAFGRVTEQKGVYGVTGSQGPTGLSGYSGCSGYSGFSGFSGCAGSIEDTISTVRKSIQDSLFCDLVKVNRETTLEIQLPDVIGLFEIKAFIISGLDWHEYQADLRIEKDLYIEPLVPQFAHPEDEIYCRAIIVGKDNHKKRKITVKVSGKTVKHQEILVGSNLHIKWKASAGSHEVFVQSENSKGEIIGDKVMRVVESPSEETVLTQEIRFIKPKKSYSIYDEDAISITVLPGIEDEFKRTLNVCTDYQHACCEQTSACIVGAALAIMTGDDGSKDKGYKSIVAGEARLKTLFNGSAFRYYPDREINFWAHKVACARLKRVAPMLSEMKLPDDVMRAISSIKSMTNVAENYVSNSNDHSYNWYQERLKQTPMERAYLENSTGMKVEESARKFLAKSKLEWNDAMEACYCAAILIQSPKYVDLGIDLVNIVSKSMKGLSGWLGTEVIMAYMSLMYELTKAKLVGTSVKLVVNDEEMTIKEAMGVQNITSIKAKQGAVLIRVNRLVKLNYDEFKGKMPMSINMNKTNLRAGDTVTLTVKLENGYKDGDVLLVMLPDCLSRIVGGAQTKKFEIDFAGKNAVSVDLAVQDKTEKPQKWGAVVRNMYDSNRIGCVGLMSVNATE